MDLVTSDKGWAEPTVLEGQAIPTAVIRHEGVTIAELRELFDSAYPEVALAAGAQSNPPAGPALSLYEGDVTRRFNVEIGFPLAAALEQPQGEVIASELPGGRVGVLSHVGPYEELPQAWERLLAWVAAESRTPGPRFGEIYVTEPGPETDPATLRTDLFVELG